MHNYRDKRRERHTWIVCITYGVLTRDEIGLEQFMIINNYDKKKTLIYITFVQLKKGKIPKEYHLSLKTYI